MDYHGCDEYNAINITDLYPKFSIISYKAQNVEDYYLLMNKIKNI